MVEYKIVYVYQSELKPHDDLIITNYFQDDLLIGQFTKPEQLLNYLIDYNLNKRALILNNDLEVWNYINVKQITIKDVTNLFK